MLSWTIVAVAATRAPLPAVRVHARCATPVCKGTEPTPPVGLRCLDQQEVVDIFNAVPVFGVVNSAEQLVAEPDESGGEDATTCRFFLEISEAQASATALREANPASASASRFRRSGRRLH